MNVRFPTTAQLRGIVKRQFIRNTCKISLVVDPSVVIKLENDEVKPRYHPGIVKKGSIKLPLNVTRALERIMENYPLKKLLKDCYQLESFIIARHPSVEQRELSTQKCQVIEEFDHKVTSDELSKLSEKEALQWPHKRETTVCKILKQRTCEWKSIIYGTYEALLYAICRCAKEFGVLSSILREIRARDPGFQPKSFFDFGSGFGTGMWAASSFWKDTIFEYYNVDSSREMNNLSELILREGNENRQPLLRNVYYRQYLPATETSYDLVLSSYSLFELPTAENRRDVILNLWEKCSGYLIIVEEGTRRASELVNEARDLLLNLKNENIRGEVFAPCPHNSACPRFANAADRSPCNFEVGYVPLHVGNIKVDRRTARYSYVVLKKGYMSDRTCKWPRLVRATLPRSKHVVCRMCTSNAMLQEVVFTQSKHGRFAYRCAKVSKWGDRLPIIIS